MKLLDLPDAQQPFPTLARLLKIGKVFISEGEYKGCASDGTVVSFGSTGLGNEPSVESYLQANPNSIDW